MFNIHILIIGLLSFLFSFFITWLYRKWALQRSVLDIPNERSSHSVATPKGGGISIVIAFYAGLFIFFTNGNIDRDLFFALLPGLIIALVGFLDVLKNLSPATRFITQFVCSGTALYLLGGFNGFFGQGWLMVWSALALVGMVWFINLFNFLDGSDGYASMETIAVSFCLWYFSRMDILLILAFATGGFLFWNWPKARIFMGDIGSTTLGFILVVFGIYFHNREIISFNSWLLITALFWFDATVTLIRRAMNKEKLSKAHKKHMYQRAIQGGFSHLHVLLAGLVINIVIFFISLVIFKNNYPYLPGLLLALIILWLVMKYVDHKFAFNRK